MFFDTVQSDVLTVSAYAARLGRALRAVGGAIIEGEVQKPRQSGGGTLWFSVTDGDAVLTCKVFPRQVRALDHIPREGDLVRIEVERPDLWAQAGKLDLIVSQISLAGEGELLRRRAALIERLGEEGLCDPARRRPLPRFPRAVGVIAGKDSDAMSDVVRALIDRWPAVHVVTCDSLVQGKSAPRDLIDALAYMTEHPLVDVVIVARGGGSVQDLACFDDEGLCRAVFACELPVVCAIGHTNNDPVCNHVAWPAYTPSRSAEMAVPCAERLRRDMAAIRDRLDGLRSRLALLGERLQHTSERVSASAGQRVGRMRELVDREGAQVGERVRRRLGDARRDAAHAGALVAAHDFRSRGWLLAATGDGVPIRSAADLHPGERIALRLHDGEADAVIQSKRSSRESDSHERSDRAHV